RRKADVTRDPEERLAILFRMAALQEETLGRPAEAIDAYNEILAHDAENVRALRALDRLYHGAERWRDLGDNLVRQLALADVAGERIRILLRLAELRETRLDEGAAAIETYRQVLDLDPGDPDATGALE